MKRNFYFTFGSSKRFPYQNGYLIVQASSIQQAIALFRVYYPDFHEGTVNCSDYYNQIEWDVAVRRYYQGRLPFEIIESKRTAVQLIID